MASRPVPLILMALVVLGAVAHAGCASRSGLPTLPPLNDPAAGEHLLGKFVWADLLTNDLPGARRFYGELLGWEWRWVSEGSQTPYGIFYKDGEAVAGVAYVDPPEIEETYARWVHYLSVEDVAAATSEAEQRGGHTLLPRHDVAQRGEFAVLADPEDAPFGILRSSSGDPPDFRARVGEWLWIGLFSRDAKAAASFYASTFGYEIHAPRDDSEVLDIVLAESGHSRAGIAELSPGSASKPIWLGYVRVDDVGAALEKTRSLSGKVIYAPPDGELAGVLAIIEDPLGAPIGLLRWNADEEAPAGREVRP